MKNRTRFITLVLVLGTVLSLCIGSFTASGAAYVTYTYSIDGEYMVSPDAYTPDKVVTSSDLGLVVPLDTPKDLFVDYNNRVYIADPKNNRILVTDKHMTKVLMTLNSFDNSQGIRDSLSAAEGVFVTKGVETKPGQIYVADTGNRRIVVFDYDGNYIKHFDKPKSDVFDTDALYSPVALAVDSAGRIYVVSKDTYEGVISLNADGTFCSILASNKVTTSFLSAIWNRFKTAAQKEQEGENLSNSFNNIAIDDDGMIYVTTDTLDEGAQQSAISGKSTSGDYAPVKKLNPDGDDIMRRNGFYPPSGEVKVRDSLTTSNSGTPTKASKIVDVAVGQEGTWSIVDQKRSHIYTYDKNGNLLFIFGDIGSQLGSLQTVSAICYQNETAVDTEETGLAGRLLALDSFNNSITIYNRTEYGNILMTALRHTNNKEYDKAVDDWRDILQRNNNYDAAYVGIGDALYREGKWEEAMDMYKTAYDLSHYSDAFKMYRKDLISKIIFWIVLVIVVLLVAVSKFFGFAAKVNKKASVKKGKKNFGEQILYAFHVMFHPFDGFWDLKHEGRGSTMSATFWLVLTIFGFIYQAFGSGPAATGFSRGSVNSAIFQSLGVIVPLMLFVVANWCLTTLFDGEGSFKNVYVATCYAAAPLSFLIILSTIVSNFVATSELGFVSLISGLGWVWFFLLLFFGIMTTHDYTMGKNILTFLGTVVGMAIIMFILVLFSGLFMKMSSFVSNIATELSFRG